MNSFSKVKSIYSAYGAVVLVELISNRQPKPISNPHTMSPYLPPQNQSTLSIHFVDALSVEKAMSYKDNIIIESSRGNRCKFMISTPKVNSFRRKLTWMHHFYSATSKNESIKKQRKKNVIGVIVCLVYLIQVKCFNFKIVKLFMKIFLLIRFKN